MGAAQAHLQRVDYPVVIKASGLAAGKGVILPASVEEAEAALRQIMVEREFGAAGDEVVIEERLEGPEASVLAFCDGQTLARFQSTWPGWSMVTPAWCAMCMMLPTAS